MAIVERQFGSNSFVFAKRYWKTIPIAGFYFVLVTPYPVSADEIPAHKAGQPYKGRVQERAQVRLVRPLPDAKSDFAIHKSGASKSDLQGKSLFQEDTFIKQGNTSSAPKPDNSNEHALNASANKTEQKSEKNEKAPPEPVKSKELAAPEEDYYPASHRYNSKKVLIRLKRYRSQSEMEVVWEAARAGLRWLRKGADVTILLDMDGINAASKSETGLAYYEPNRGNGNSSGEKISSPQDQLTQFIQAGGKLLACDRWVKLRGLSPGSLISGTKLLSEDEIDDIMLDSSYNVVYY